MWGAGKGGSRQRRAGHMHECGCRRKLGGFAAWLAYENRLGCWESSAFVVGIDVMWVRQVWDARSRDQTTITSKTPKVSPNGWLLGPDAFLWAWLWLEGLLYFITVSVCVCMCVCLSRSVVSNSPIPWTVALQAPLSMRILQARILEWVPLPSSRGYSQCRDWTWVSCVAGRFFTMWATREAPLKPLPISSLSPLESISDPLPTGPSEWGPEKTTVFIKRLKNHYYLFKELYSMLWTYQNVYRIVSNLAFTCMDRSWVQREEFLLVM